MKNIIILVIISAALLLSCATDRQAASPDEENVITDRYWKLIELNGREITFDNNMMKEAHIILNKNDYRITGSGGCNLINGSFMLSKGQRISFTQIASTMMSCPDIEIETEFLKVLEMCDNYSINDDVLTLNKAKNGSACKI